MVHVIQVCWQLASRISTESLSANLYDIYHCCVYREKLMMMDRGTVRNMWSDSISSLTTKLWYRGAGNQTFLLSYQILIIKQPDALISNIYFWNEAYMFRTVPLQAGSGRKSSSVLILFASCMTCTTVVCTVKNSWWWTEELSETCRVLFQK